MDFDDYKCEQWGESGENADELVLCDICDKGLSFVLYYYAIFVNIN